MVEWSLVLHGGSDGKMRDNWNICILYCKVYLYREHKRDIREKGRLLVHFSNFCSCSVEILPFNYHNCIYTMSLCVTSGSVPRVSVLSIINPSYGRNLPASRSWINCFFTDVWSLYRQVTDRGHVSHIVLTFERTMTYPEEKVPNNKQIQVDRQYRPECIQ